jgi:antitoxin YefM
MTRGSDIAFARIQVVAGFKSCLPDHLAIILAMETRSLAEVKNRLSEFVERVSSQHDRVTITRNGRPAAVLVSPDDLDSLEETLSVLGDAKEIAVLRKGLADLDAGRTISLNSLKADLGFDE